jgi:CheY-like chemotaxis protein
LPDEAFAMTSSGFVVLVVEDDVLTRIDVARTFEASGWVALEAGSGQAALELCNSDTPVDALVTDIDLGNGATGWDVAQAFWRRDAIPVVYTSANPDMPRCRVPQSRFLAKPCLSFALIKECVQLHARFRQEKTRRWPIESSRDSA